MAQTVTTSPPVRGALLDANRATLAVLAAAAAQALLGVLAFVLDLGNGAGDALLLLPLPLLALATAVLVWRGMVVARWAQLVVEILFFISLELHVVPGAAGVCQVLSLLAGIAAVYLLAARVEVGTPEAVTAETVPGPPPVATGTPVLEVDGVTKIFGGLRAVDAITFSINEGEIVAMIGPNGAGKTTAFNCVTGLYPLSGGDVRFYGQSVAGIGPHRIARLGITRTFQNIRLFSYMTAVDNVMVGEHCRMRAKVWDAVFRSGIARHEESAVERRALAILRDLGLERYADVYARNLPYGLQRRLEIARALASRPRLLLLDEPAAGLNPQEKVELMGLISQLRDRGITIFLIEHDMRLVMRISDRIVVLDHGEKIAEGKPEEVRNNPRVVEAYLGTGAAGAAT